MDELHSHHCRCGNRWQHALPEGCSRSEHQAAHTCCECGTQVYAIHSWPLRNLRDLALGAIGLWALLKL